jgi:hypothetical protein
MMIAVTVVAILCAFALPRLNYGAMRLDANAQAIRATLQQAWRLSIQKQHDVIVSFDVGNQRLRTLEDENDSRTADPNERITWRPLEEGAAFSKPPVRIGNAAPPAAIAGAGVVTVDQMPSLVFHRNGSTSGDAEVYLGIMSAGKTERRAVTVSQSTGRTDWYRYFEGTWRNAGL